MLKLITWFVAIAAISLLVWQMAVAEALWVRVSIGLVAAIASLLIGIRIGTDAAAAYTKDLQRLNKVLADQNHDLQDANAMLLREVDAETVTPPKSSCA